MQRWAKVLLDFLLSCFCGLKIKFVSNKSADCEQQKKLWRKKTTLFYLRAPLNIACEKVLQEVFNLNSCIVSLRGAECKM